MSLSGGGDTEQQQQRRRRRRGFICVGGSSGMGKAAALECLRHDGHVLLISRSIEKLEAAKRELIDCIQHDTATTTRTTNDIAERIRIMSLDVTDETAIQEFVATEIQKYKESPDHHPCYDTLVISAAGKAAHGPVRTLSTSATREMLETKLWTAYHCSKYMSDLLLLLNKEHMHDSSIVFVGGILNRRPGVNCVPLAMANGALEGLCRSLALELAPLHIRVNCLSPGFCDTERFDHMDPAKKQAMLAHTASSLPLQRVGQPRDMGHAIFFLATNEFTTGVVLDVDGGHLIRQYASSADTDPMRNK
jgi:NAD(P)-dependent dehydrogenase (short-subunit alcohol dehydrogenase family)